MKPKLAVLDRFEDSGDILSAIERAFHDATHEIGRVNVLIIVEQPARLRRRLREMCATVASRHGAAS